MIEKQVNNCMAAHHTGKEQLVLCHPALFVWKYCHGMSQNRILLFYVLKLRVWCLIVIVICDYSPEGTAVWMNFRQSLDHRTECPKLDTATSILLRLIPRNNSAGAPGKWERKVPFFFFETKRNVAQSWWFLQNWHARSPSVVFLPKQECGSVNWLALIRPVWVPITAWPQRNQTENSA